ncbi:MAG: hypothetical protein EXS76_02710 [Nitrosarchaeum sp.]|nr:hypothetical protein [Nitrosarchaeum sp.]
MLNYVVLLVVIGFLSAGALAPSFGAFPDKSTIDTNVFSETTDVIIWTDKDHYKLGETVNVKGRFSPYFFNSIPDKNQEVVVSIIEYPNHKFFESKIISLNSDGTFSTNFKLPNDLGDVKWGRMQISAMYCKYHIEFCDTKNNKGLFPTMGWKFSIGDFPNKPFTIEMRENHAYNLIQDGVIINNLASTEDNFFFRLVTASGISIHSQAGSTGKYQAIGFGKYEVIITHGDIVKKIPLEHKPNPTEFVKIWVSDPHGKTVNHSQNIRIDIDMLYPNPDNPYYTFKIIDPSGNIVFSGDGEFYASERNSGQTPPYNRIISAWSTKDFDTDKLPKISGVHTIEVNYEGKVGSTTFEIIAFEKEFELNKIYSNIESLMDKSGYQIEKNFGKDYADQYHTLNNNNDYDSRIKANTELFTKQQSKLEQMTLDFEKDVKNWDISLDEKADIIYDFRNKIDMYNATYNRIFKNTIQTMETDKLQSEHRLKLEEYSKITAERLQKEAEEKENIAKEKIKQEIQVAKEKIKQEILDKEKISVPEVEKSIISKPIIDPEPKEESKLDTTSEPVMKSERQILKCNSGFEIVDGKCITIKQPKTEENFFDSLFKMFANLFR